MRSTCTLLVATLLIFLPAHSQYQLTLAGGTVVNATTLADDLAYPTAVSLAPDGAVWVSDGYTGNIWRFAPGGLRTLVGTIPLALKINDGSRFGILFDVEILDVEGDGTYTVMTMYTTADDRLQIGKCSYDGVRLSAPTLVLDVANVPARLGHSMTRLADNTLAVSVGSFDNPNPSNLNLLNGKLIRIDVDGAAPVDNPMYNAERPFDAASYVYSFGHRHLASVTQIPTDRSTIGGRLFGVEPGAYGASEINLIVPGADHGWRHTEGFCVAPVNSFACPKATTEFVPSCVAYYASSAIPEWNNTLLVGTISLYGGMLVADVNAQGDIINIDPMLPADNVLTLDDTRQFLFVTETGIERPRAVTVSSDGRVFLAVVDYAEDGTTRGRVMVLENPAVHTPMGVNDAADHTAQMSFGPNPVQDVLNVHLNESPATRWTARIFDLMGRPVAQRSMDAGTASVTLETAHLVSGSYLLVIDNGTTQMSAPLVR